MADQTFRSADQGRNGPSQGFEKAATAAKSVADQALSASREIRDKAIGLASASSETIQNQASDFVDAAKDVASQATDKFKQTVEGQKSAGANYVGSLAGTIVAPPVNLTTTFRSPAPISARRRRRSKASPIRSGAATLMISCEGPNPLPVGNRPHFSEWPCLPASASFGS